MRRSTHPFLLGTATAVLIACPSPDDPRDDTVGAPAETSAAPEPESANLQRQSPPAPPAPAAVRPTTAEPRAAETAPPSDRPADAPSRDATGERAAAPSAAAPPTPSPTDARVDEPADPTVGNPFALPRGGAVADADQKIETVRQLIDGLAQDALVFASRLSGDQPDVTGSTDVDRDAEKRSYVERLRRTHRRMRELMHAVARCPDADPGRPVANRSAPVNALATEIDRYASARATATEANRHIERMRPLVVRWKSVYIDPAAAKRASEPRWSPPRDLVRNWCP